MNVAILAGGRGTRLAGNNGELPKPLTLIGGQPILLHVMEACASSGLTDFVIALGYMGDVIRDYFDSPEFKDTPASASWNIELVDTGTDTKTGGRIKRLEPRLQETFMLLWSDGLSDANLQDVIAFHRSHGKTATLMAVHPPSRFGHLDLKDERITGYSEKPINRDAWVSGGMFVLEPAVFDYIEGDETSWEKEPLERLAREGELMAYRHDSFWQCMDHVHDQNLLETLWQNGQAPWRRPG